MNGAVNNFNGWGVTLIDALDTMWIMDLRREFEETIPIVANMTFHLPKGENAPFFETVIRYLGGLLSAYALSGGPTLLVRADDLGRMLLPAFNTTHGLPMYAVNTVTYVVYGDAQRFHAPSGQRGNEDGMDPVGRIVVGDAELPDGVQVPGSFNWEEGVL